MVDAYGEFFEGYEASLRGLDRTFDDVRGYDDLVMVRDIRIQSHCEHHIVPLSAAHVAYFPAGACRHLQACPRCRTFRARLQTQETMTAQIAKAIENRPSREALR